MYIYGGRRFTYLAYAYREGVLKVGESWNPKLRVQSISSCKKIKFTLLETMAFEYGWNAHEYEQELVGYYKLRYPVFDGKEYFKVPELAIYELLQLFSIGPKCLSK